MSWLLLESVALCAPPTGVGVAIAGTQGTVTWSDASGDEAAFRVYRVQGDGTTGTFSNVSGDLAPNTVSYFDGTGLAASTQYTWYVVSVNSAGEESKSANFTTTTGVSAAIHTAAWTPETNAGLDWHRKG